MHEALQLFKPEDNDYNFEEARLEIALKDANGKFYENNPREIEMLSMAACTDPFSSRIRTNVGHMKLRTVSIVVV